ncbi:ion channel [Vulcaniibacterium gelatinicum]|uniref:ion channel n=1 Tax=Vulcaniibacterium gelatinicum TaxID=2598725 RepID=UPI0011C7ECA7|nr:ion channel [Vulcaniibacterium gelatinicum]
MQAPARLRVWAVLARRHPSAFLLAAQLLSLLLYPLMDETPAGRMLFGAVALVVVPLAVWVVNRSPFVTGVAWALAIPAVALTVLGVLTGEPALLPVSATLEALLYFYAAGSLISYMLHDHRVTADELFAAGATFTLFAWGFAYAYFVCQAWYPGSFGGAVEPDRPRTWMELLFMSFTVLSGVGIGDVIPLAAPARVLVMLEMFTGVGYLAMVVSRLISLTVLRGIR